MSRIKEFRASLDKKLDALEHQALALEAHLIQTKDQAMQRLEQRKEQLSRAPVRIDVRNFGRGQRFFHEGFQSINRGGVSVRR